VACKKNAARGAAGEIWPFRVFGKASRTRPLPFAFVLVWDWLLVQSIWYASVSLYWLGDSTLPLAVLPGCVVFPVAYCPGP
jgi:hypothetical protein